MTGAEGEDLFARVREWLEDDPDPETRAELAELLDEARTGAPAATADLVARFAGPLRFGTAGIRGVMGAGPARINRVVVARTAAGLAAHLRERGATGPVVVGYDARRHSDVFARDAAEVLAGAGVPTLLMARALPTPLLAHTVRERGCAAGVMVTASHNPAADNGLKVYVEDGGQIVPPEDAEVAAHIDAVGRTGDLPRGVPRLLGDEVVDHYLDTVADLAEDGPRDLAVVFTPLHGVGGEAVVQVLETAGFASPRVVGQQEQPDPDFPTVPFPNPEVPGTLDLALALAEQHAADLVVATDPDADRCAVAVPTPGGWRVLRGDEVGVLLAQQVIARGGEGALATTVVSSRLLGRMARVAGRPYVETLTGFKWLARVSGLAFAYEEALGYCVDPDHVRDKDGISAVLRVCEIAAEAKAAGRTLPDLLDDVAREHGVHLTDQVTVPVAGSTEVGELMTRLRHAPPADLDGVVVTAADDLALGGDELPPTDAVRWWLADGSRVVVRPSGTEPLLKAYLEVVAEPGPDVAALRVSCAGRLDALRLAVASLLR